MKNIIFLLLILISISVQGQSSTCANAAPLCASEGLRYKNTDGYNLAENGPDYGCLKALNYIPNPGWFYLQVEEPGDLKLQISQVGNLYGSWIPTDVDFIVWGPFSSLNNVCDNLTATNIVDCSSSSQSIENAKIPNTQTGEYYILSITNYALFKGYISVKQTNLGGTGAGTTDCDIVTGNIYYECDDDGDKKEEFDLKAIMLDVTRGNANLNPSAHLTLKDAVNDQNPLTSTFTNTNNPTKLYIRQDHPTLVYVVTEVQLIVADIPVLTTKNLVVCDDDTDGIGTFDLTTATGNTEKDVKLSYHTTQTNAINNANAIKTPKSHNSATASIWIRAENITTGCANTTEITLTVNQSKPNAGTNGTLNICQGITPTNTQLLGALGGNPTKGGTWSNVGNIYTYTLKATAPCKGTATATVTLNQQSKPNAGTNGTLNICQGITPTNTQLLGALGGNPTKGGTWSNVGNIYTYTLKATAPCKGTATATVTLNQQSKPNAGTNGTLNICQGITPTNTQLLGALGGNPTKGGTWSNVGNIYTYTLKATAPCEGTATATVTLNQQSKPNAGTNGTLNICQGITPTNTQLLGALGGNPTKGGTWSNVGNIYTYTLKATAPCKGTATATVTLNQQSKPNAGTNGTLNICQGITPTNTQLLGALGGNPTKGGTWSNVGNIYTYTLKATAPCEGTATATVTLNQQSKPNAGTNGTLNICQGITPTNTQLLGALGGNPTKGGTWSNVGNIYTYTLKATAPCEGTATATVTLNQQSKPNAGTNGTLNICQGITPTNTQLLGALGGNPTKGGTWSNVGNIYTYTLKATAPCEGTATATVTLNQQSKPNAGTNGTLNICQGITPTNTQLLGALGGNPTKGGTWSNVGNIYTYTLKATAPCKGTATATVTLNQQSKPNAGTNGTLNICQGITPTNTQLLGALGGNPTKGGTWSNVGNIYTYTLKATAPCEGTATATVTLNQQSKPNAGTNGTLNICQGITPTNTQLLGALGGNPTKGGTWSNVGNIYTYTLKATAPCKGTATATVTLNQQSKPNAGTNGTLNICQGITPTNTQLLGALGGNPTKGGTWSNVGNIYTYTLKATAPCEGTATATVTLNQQSKPNAGTNGTLNICQGITPTNTQLLGALGGNPTKGGTWSNVGNIYTYTLKATAPCEGTATATVTLNQQSKPNAGTNGTLNICQGITPTNTQLLGALGGNPTKGGTWSNVGNIYTYTLKATAPCKGTATATVTLNQQSKPNAGTNGTLNICQGITPTNTQLLGALGGNPTKGGTWSNVGNIYTYTLKATAPCKGTATATVTLNQQSKPNAGTNGTLNICQGITPTNTQLLGALGGNPTKGGTWSNVGNIYTYTLKATAPCEGTATATVTLNQQSKPNAGTNGTLNICQGITPTNTQLLGALGGNPTKGGTWSNVGNIYTYTLKATAPCKGTATATVTLNQQSKPNAGTNGTLNICQGITPTNTQLLGALGGNPTKGGTWSNVGNIYTYTLKATAPCEGTATATVTLNQQSKPNAGTNGTLNICQGITPTNTQLLGALGGNPTKGGTWSNVGNIYTYTLKATAPCKGTATATVTLNQQSKPNAGTNGTLNICQGITPTNTQLLGALGGNPTKGGTWSNVGNIYTYTLKATAPCEGTATATVTLNQQSKPNAGTNGTLNICQGITPTNTQLLGALGGNPTKGGTWSNVGNIYTYTLKATAPCKGTATATVTLNQQSKPNAGTNGTLNICQGITPTNTQLLGALGGNPTKGGTWSNVGNIYTYTLKATAPCEGTATATVTLNQQSKPNAGTNGTLNICQGITPTNTQLLGALGGNPTKGGTWSNVGNIYTYTLKATAPCEGTATATVTLNQQSKPNAGTNGTLNICQGITPTNTQLLGALGGNPTKGGTWSNVGNIYTYTLKATAPCKGTATATVTLNQQSKPNAGTNGTLNICQGITPTNTQLLGALGGNPTKGGTWSNVGNIYTYTLKATAPCKGTATATVTLNQQSKPNAGTNGTLNICQGITPTNTQLLGALGGNPTKGGTWSNVGNIYTYTLKATAPCKGTATATVTLNQQSKPNAGTNGTLNICQGITPTNTQLLGALGGNPTKGGTWSNVGNIYTYTLKATAPCKGTATATVTLNQQSKPNAGTNGTLNICQGITPTNTQLLGALGGNPTKGGTWSNVGNIYTYTLKATAPCKGTATATVTLNQQSKPNAGTNGTLNICQGITPTNTQLLGALGGNPTKGGTWSNVGNIYTYTLKATAPCEGTATATVTLNQQSKPNAGTNGTLNICQGITPTNTQLLGALGGNPTKGGTWSNVGNIYTYTLKATAPCEGTATATVTLNQQSKPNAGTNGTLNICQGITPTNTQLLGALGGNPTKGGTWSNVGNIYTYTLKATAPCKGTATATVTLNQQSKPNAGTNGTLNICQGITPTNTQLLGALGGNPTKGGTWSNVGNIYTYTLKATAPCKGTATATVTLNQQSKPNAGTNGTLNICQGITPTNTQLLGALGGNPTKGGTWSNVGNIYTYTLKATAPCKGTATATVTLNQQSKPNAGTNGTLNICQGITPTNTQLLGALGGNPTKGGTWSNVGNIYTYTLKATAPCEGTATATVTLNQQSKPNAGTNGTLNICQGITPTNTQLLGALGGNPTKGGTWSNVGNIYTYTLKATAPCEGTATATVTLNQQSKPNAGTNGTLNICQGITPTNTQLLGALGGNPTKGGTWSNVGNIYTYTLKATAPCEGTATATVTLNQQSKPNAGTNGTLNICQGITPTNTQLLGALGGNPTKGGTWSNVGNIYTYTLKATAPCEGTATATVTLNQQSKPNAGTNGTLNICQGITPTNTQLLGALGGNPTKGGTWSNVGNIYTYTLKATAPCKGTATATVTLNQQSKPNAGTNGTLNICQGITPTNTQLLGALGGNPTKGGTWSNVGNIYTYTLKATAPCKGTATATVTLNQQSKPNAGTNGTLNICQGITPTNTQLLGALGGNPTKGGTWSNVGNIYTYTLKATAPCKGTATATVTLNQQSKPNAGTNGTLNICQGITPTNTQLLGALGGNPTKGGTWSNVGNIYTYTLKATAPCEGTATATVTLNQQSKPNAGTNGTLNICQGITPTNTQLLGALGGNPTKGGTWSNVGNIYTYTLKATAPCKGTATATVTLNQQSKPNAGTNGTLNICQGITPTNTQLLGALGGNPTKGGTWSNVGNIYTYTLKATAPCEGTATATVTLNQQSKPNAGTNGTLNICQGITPTNTQLLGALGGNPTKGGTWSNVGNIYTYTLKATAPCKGTATATVTLNQQSKPNAGTNGTLNICQGITPTNTQLLGALGGNPTKGGTWSNVGNIYTYTLKATAPCEGTATATVTLNQQSKPNAGTNGTLNICQGITPTNTQLLGALGGNPTKGGTWSNVGNIYTYTLKATAPCEGTATATVTVTEQPKPNAGTNGIYLSLNRIKPNKNNLFNSLLGIPDKGGKWTRNNDKYIYTVVNKSNCTDTATVKIIAVLELITPNNDGINDIFSINNIHKFYPNFSIEIFNRSGNSIFLYKHNNNMTNTPKWWNGKENNIIANEGTYFYIIHFGNHKKAIQGWIYLKK